LKDYVKALADFDKAISLDSNNPRAYSSRGEFYLIQKNYRQAIADTSQAIRLNSKDGYAFNIRSEAYRRLGEIDKAKADQKKSELYGFNDEGEEKEP